MCRQAAQTTWARLFASAMRDTPAMAFLVSMWTSVLPEFLLVTATRRALTSRDRSCAFAILAFRAMALFVMMSMSVLCPTVVAPPIPPFVKTQLAAEDAAAWLVTRGQASRVSIPPSLQVAHLAPTDQAARNLVSVAQQAPSVISHRATNAQAAPKEALLCLKGPLILLSAFRNALRVCFHSFHLHNNLTLLLFCLPYFFYDFHVLFGDRNGKKTGQFGPQMGMVPCTPCPIGQYQPLAGNSSCLVCPENRLTLSTYSTSLSDCRVTCWPGSFGVKGLGPCTNCSVGLYSDANGSPICKVCPEGKTTRTSGSTSINQCLSVCDFGSFGSFGLEPCQACPLGTFSNNSASSFCWKCPAGFSTATSGQSSEISCKKLCPAGTKSGTENGLAPCATCQIGSFAPVAGVTACTMCPNGTTTTGGGETSAASCKPICKPGSKGDFGLGPW